jgi:hypothetical protein
MTSNRDRPILCRTNDIKHRVKYGIALYTGTITVTSATASADSGVADRGSRLISTATPPPSGAEAAMGAPNRGRSPPLGLCR